MMVFTVRPSMPLASGVFSTRARPSAKRQRSYAAKLPVCACSAAVRETAQIREANNFIPLQANGAVRPCQVNAKLLPFQAMKRASNEEGRNCIHLSRGHEAQGPGTSGRRAHSGVDADRAAGQSGARAHCV